MFDDPKMGWSRWAHSFHIFTLNSGLFYTKANDRTKALMDVITARLSRENAWDQAVFNEEVWKPSAGKQRGNNVSVRIMDIYDFVNSKTLFRTMRYEKQYENHMPVMVHVNYHPDKFARMQSVWARYVDGDKHALDKYPVGMLALRDACMGERGTPNHRQHPARLYDLGFMVWGLGLGMLHGKREPPPPPAPGMMGGRPTWHLCLLHHRCAACSHDLMATSAPHDCTHSLSFSLTPYPISPAGSCFNAPDC